MRDQHIIGNNFTHGQYKYEVVTFCWLKQIVGSDRSGSYVIFIDFLTPY